MTYLWQVGERTLLVHILPRGSRTYRAGCSQCIFQSTTIYTNPLRALLEARHTCFSS